MTYLGLREKTTTTTTTTIKLYQAHVSYTKVSTVNRKENITFFVFTN